MTDLRAVYATKALNQIPRLLGNQDRNPLSPTYGCFHRDYWLDKTSDFPDAVRQFAVHALAMVYVHQFPGNIYYGQQKIRDWAIAGLDYWTRIQHTDGSFDEFYPFERGWVGPTAFTTFTSVEAYTLLKDELPDEVALRVRQAIRKAAYFIIAGESEEDHLANHHAMACLAVWKAYKLLDEPALKTGFQERWRAFLTYHNENEGWSREYDGVDPGYLSATVSFLSKIYKTNPDPAILRVLKQSVEFCSYFVYPNGFYAGSMGSRNTLHFYAHGFEVIAKEIPLAGAIAEKMLQALSEQKLVPPEIISDRYVVYRVPEFLEAYLDYTPRPDNLANLPLLPYEQEPFTRYFPESRIFVATRDEEYVIANLAKGGVIKVFDRKDGHLLLNDGGFLGKLDDDRVVTSQWIDPAYLCEADEEQGECEVRGQLQMVPSHKLFTLTKNLIFRSTLFALGWNPEFSHMLKGNIRRVLMLGRRPVPVVFSRKLLLEEQGITLINTIQTDGSVKFTSLSVGDEFFVRYVPQSRYFQSQELETQRYEVGHTQLQSLNDGHPITLQRQVFASAPHSQSKTPSVHVNVQQRDSAHADLQIAYWENQRKRRDPADPLVAAFVEPKIAFIRQHVSLPDAPKILDVGCGNGYFTYYLDQLTQTGDASGSGHSGTTIGIDFAKAMLQLNPCDNLMQGSALDLPFQDGSFDMVFCSNILHHIEDPVAVVREMRRVSNKYVVIHEPNRNNPAMLALGLLKEEERLSLQYTQPFVRSLAERAGLQIVACETIGFVTPNRMPKPIADYLSSLNAPNPLAAYHVVVALIP